MTGYQPVINHHHILVLLNGKYKIYKSLLTYISKPKTVCTNIVYTKIAYTKIAYTKIAYTKIVCIKIVYTQIVYTKVVYT